MQRKIGNHLPIAADLPLQIGRNPRLERLAQRFDWERLGAVVQDSSAAPTGRPSYLPLMLVKCCASNSGTPPRIRSWPPRCVTACPSDGSSGWGWRTRPPTTPRSVASASS